MSTGEDQAKPSPPIFVSQSFPLLRLPRELRDRVYEMIFDSLPAPVSVNEKGYVSPVDEFPWSELFPIPHPETQIFRVNKQISQESKQTFYRMLNLRLKYCDSAKSPGYFDCTELIRRLPLEHSPRTFNAAVFRAVQIDVRHYNYDWSTMNEIDFAADIACALQQIGIDTVTSLSLLFETPASRSADGYFTDFELRLDPDSGHEFGRIAIKYLAEKFGLPRMFEGIHEDGAGTPGCCEDVWQSVELIATTDLRPSSYYCNPRGPPHPIDL